jgi:hypothetical protein
MLRTIGDVGEYILALSGKRRRLARRLLMKETSVATMSHQVYLSFGAAIIEKFFLLPNWENVNISYIIGRPAMMGKADRLPP